VELVNVNKSNKY